MTFFHNKRPDAVEDRLDDFDALSQRDHQRFDAIISTFADRLTALEAAQKSTNEFAERRAQYAKRKEAA